MKSVHSATLIAYDTSRTFFTAPHFKSQVPIDLAEQSYIIVKFILNTYYFCRSLNVYYNCPSSDVTKDIKVFSSLILQKRKLKCGEVINLVVGLVIGKVRSSTQGSKTQVAMPTKRLAGKQVKRNIAK